MDLSTTYLGLKLAHPLMAGASPLSDDLDAVRRLEDAGASAIVLRSLFEEQITRELEGTIHHMDIHAGAHAEALSYFPDPGDFRLGPQAYLEHLEKVKAAVSIPVIASLNGITSGGWLDYARLIERVGADALELNVYYLPTDPDEDGASVEARTLDAVRIVRGEVRIPVAVKLSPFFSSLLNFARRVDEAGADGLVLFNRLYQPDIDLDTLEVVPRLALSTSAETRLPLHWIANLYGNVSCSLAATSGVHDGADALKLLLAGADVVMTTSSLLRHGPEHLAVIERFIREWMEERDYEDVGELRGSVSRRNVPDPQVYERQNYYQVLHSWVPDRPR